MKKTLIIILLIFFLIAVSTYLFLINVNNIQKNLKKDSEQYGLYLNQNIYGTELATLINKAIDQNEKNKIAKDEKNYYIVNDVNSIKIEVKMNTTDKTYAMEEIYNNNITEFVKYFNLAEFKCTVIEYHMKTGKLSKMVFEEVK